MVTELKDLWTPAGIVLGFQVTAFAWRLSEEAAVRNKGSIPWLVPADYMNLIGMLVLVFGVFVAPFFPVGAASPWRETHVVLFGLAALLFVGQVFAMAGHYQLFNRTVKGSEMRLTWFPLQEKIAVAVTFLVGVLYLVLAAVWQGRP